MARPEYKLGIMGAAIRNELLITTFDGSQRNSSEELSPLLQAGEENIRIGNKLSFFLTPEEKQNINDEVNELDRFFVKAILLWLSQTFPDDFTASRQLIGCVEVSPFSLGRSLVTFSSTEAVPLRYAGEAGSIGVSMFTYRSTMAVDYATGNSIQRSVLESPWLVGQRGGETVIIGKLTALQTEHGDNLDQFLNQFLVLGEIDIVDYLRRAGVYKAK